MWECLSLFEDEILASSSFYNFLSFVLIVSDLLSVLSAVCQWILPRSEQTLLTSIAAQCLGKWPYGRRVTETPAQHGR